MLTAGPVDHLLGSCGADLRAHLGAGLDRFQAISLAPTAEIRRAAVALVVVDEGRGAGVAGIAPPATPSSGTAVILTRRAANLRSHAGQWALPGGRLDTGESTEEAALRELHEEVGLDLARSRVLGVLDDFMTRSGYLITPVVVWGGRVELQANPQEVASIHRIPLRELLRPDAPRLESIEGSDQPVLRMPVGEDAIAAPTAAILYQFREVVLLHRTVRVAHYEQPEFAWR